MDNRAFDGTLGHAKPPEPEPTMAAPESVEIEVESEDDNGDRDCITQVLEAYEKIRDVVLDVIFEQYLWLLGLVLFVAFLVYFAFAMKYEFGDEGSIMLLVITIVIILVVLNKILNAFGIYPKIPSSFTNKMESLSTLRKVIRYFLYIATFVFIAVFLTVDILHDNPENLHALIGLVALIAASVLMSKKPSQIKWHPIFWGFAIQFVLGYIVIQTSPGYETFKWMGDAVSTFFSWADSGGEFLFRPLYTFPSPGLAVSVCAMVVFFNALIKLMNYWGVIEVIFINSGKVLSWILETSPVESITAVSSIFLGPAEISFILGPYINSLTKSELHCVLTCGFASISGISMALFLQIGAPPDHLIAAAVVSAPAALCAAKLYWPETEKVNYEEQSQVGVKDKKSRVSESALGAITEGAIQATAATAKIVGLVLAYYSITHMVNEILSWMGKRVGYDRLSFELICSYVFYPISYCMGVESDDRRLVAELVGVKYVFTPLESFLRIRRIQVNRGLLAQYEAIYGEDAWHWTDDDIFLEKTNMTLKYGVMTDRSEAICTYSLAGFATFSYIGISTGALLALSPRRKKDILEVMVSAFIAGSMASFYTGSVAGLMYTD